MLGLNLFRLDLISSVVLPLHNFSPRAPILLFSGLFSIRLLTSCKCAHPKRSQVVLTALKFGVKNGKILYSTQLLYWSQFTLIGNEGYILSDLYLMYACA